MARFSCEVKGPAARWPSDTDGRVLALQYRSSVVTRDRHHDAQATIRALVPKRGTESPLKKWVA
ncbi:MAG TPA: hypothetical protein VNN74_10300 [Candidatus Micrarchaeia archaeon]|nr:hypothetical protein [Candidatus Micrarchaeia archaeon]